MCVYAIKIFMYALKLFKMEEVERKRERLTSGDRNYAISNHQKHLFISMQ